ncbi:MAG: hypothetical protein K2Y37_09775 [Pirellulales bacterium]|nr:hypothetical protein [Pirellulales bacterium]
MYRSTLTLLPLWIALLAFAGCSKPPQIVADEEAMTAVDALWTAVTSRRLELIDQSEARLRQLRDESHLNAEAFENLEGIVGKARAEDWDGAVKDLKWFIQGQRKAAK